MGNELFPVWFNELSEARAGAGTRIAKKLRTTEQLSDAQRLSVLLALGGSAETFQKNRALIGELLRGVESGDFETEIAKLRASIGVVVAEKPEPRGPRPSAEPKATIGHGEARETSE